MLTAAESIKQNKQLPTHSVSIEIYSGIARFPCDGTALLFIRLYATYAATVPPRVTL